MEICIYRVQRIIFSIRSIILNLYMKLGSALIFIAKMEIPNVLILMKQKNGFKESIFILLSLITKLISTIMRILQLHKNKNGCQYFTYPTILQTEGFDLERIFFKEMTNGCGSSHPLRNKLFTMLFISIPTLSRQNLTKHKN